MSASGAQSSLMSGNKRKAEDADSTQTASSRLRTGHFLPQEDAQGPLHGDTSMIGGAAGVSDYTFSEASRRAAQIHVPPQPPLTVFSAHNFQWQQPQAAQQQQQQDDKPDSTGSGAQQQQQDRMSLDPALSSVRSSTDAGQGSNAPKLTFTGSEDVTLDQAGEAATGAGGDTAGTGGMVADDEDLLMGDATEALARVAEEAAAQAAQMHAQVQAPQNQQQFSGQQQQQQAHAQSPLPQSGPHSIQAAASGSSTPGGGAARPDYGNPAAGSGGVPGTTGASASAYLNVPTDEFTLKKDQPFARSPELRVSHKLAERKRRKEMKELFDELRELQPAEHRKTSKWEILSKSIEMIQSMQSERSEMQRTIERLQRELNAARGLAPGSSAAAASAAAVGAGLYRMPMGLNASFSNYLDSSSSGAAGQDQGATQQQQTQQQQQHHSASAQQPSQSQSAAASQATTPQYGQVQPQQQQPGQQQGSAAGQANEQGQGLDGAKAEGQSGPSSAVEGSDHI